MKTKAKPKRDNIEELPDAWERFEEAFDKVMKAEPMPQVASGKKAIAPSDQKERRQDQSPSVSKNRKAQQRVTGRPERA